MADAAEETKKAVKLPYFHRTLSEQDAKLVGDCLPKKLSDLDGEVPSSSASAFASAWNSAGSFEEKVTTAATKELLLTVLGDYELQAGDFTIAFLDVEASGESRITVGRDKKPKFLYDYTLTISFDVKKGNGSSDCVAKGSVTLSDVMNDCDEDDIVASLKYTDSNEPKGADAVPLRKVVLNDLRAAVFKKVRGEFETLYRTKYTNE